MPLINIYFKEGVDIAILQPHASSLKVYLADRLSGKEIHLTPEEVSIRFLNVIGGEMIADIEVEIAAHAFEARVLEQDAICLDVMKFLKEQANAEVKVWLKLSQLGHSW